MELSLGGQQTSFLIDTGATFSVVNNLGDLPLIRSLTTPIVGVAGAVTHASVTQPTRQ